MSTFQSTDLIPIRRGSQTYKAEFGDMAASIVDGTAQIMGSGRRNLLANGDFSRWDYGTSRTLTTPNSIFGPSRWIVQRDGSGGTVAISRVANTPGVIFGKTEPSSFMRVQVTSAGSGATGTPLIQRVEGVRTLTQNQATLSFWAKSGGSNFTISAQAIQDFGVGGSPSSRVGSSFGSFTITNNWQRFISTCTIPSISSKTIGTSSDYLELNFSLPASAFTLDMALVQLEPGPIATPFYSYLSSEEDAMCERYYQTGTGYLGTYIDAAASVRVGQVFFQTSMRSAPSITLTPVTLQNCTTLSTSAITQDGFGVFADGLAAGRVRADFTYTANSEF